MVFGRRAYHHTNLQARDWYMHAVHHRLRARAPPGCGKQKRQLQSWPKDGATKQTKPLAWPTLWERIQELNASFRKPTSLISHRPLSWHSPDQDFNWYWTKPANTAKISITILQSASLNKSGKNTTRARHIWSPLAVWKCWNGTEIPKVMGPIFLRTVTTHISIGSFAETERR